MAAFRRLSNLPDVAELPVTPATPGSACNVNDNGYRDALTGKRTIDAVSAGDQYADGRMRRRAHGRKDSHMSQLAELSVPLRQLSSRYFKSIAIVTAALLLIGVYCSAPKYSSRLGSSLSNASKPPQPQNTIDTRIGPNPSVQQTHREIYCKRTSTGRFFRIDFFPHDAFNANIVPHPLLPQRWFIVGQKFKEEGDDRSNKLVFVELVCIAAFDGDTLRCEDPPITLTIGATKSIHCTDDIYWWNLSIGPRDARVFMGPDGPLVIYGAQSEYSCLGLFMQDFRMISDWPYFSRDINSLFDAPYDLPRPQPVARVQKNFFAFWDLHNEMYLHHDIWPRRSFTKFIPGIKLPRELASDTMFQDETCLARLLPKLPPSDPLFPLAQQSFHQGTNALTVTLCRKSKDRRCIPTADNTFIVTIIHHKSVRTVRAWYEPYVVMFRARAPFELYGVSSKPFWINGRSHIDVPDRERNTSPNRTPPGQPESFYMTSINWVSNRGHAGYLDDDVFIAFGIEDVGSGGLQISAEDLLVNIVLCDQPPL